MSPPVVVLTAHPDIGRSRVNRALMQAAARLPAEKVLVRDLYALYPDYLIDVATEQALMADAQLLVWLFPLHWYSPPPLLQLWLDEVMRYGWAYGPGGQAMQGKHLWMALSTGGTAQAYTAEGHNRHPIEDFLPPQQQTAALLGMRFWAPQVIHGAHQIRPAELDAQAQAFAQRLACFPTGPQWQTAPRPAPVCEVPTTARPGA